MIEKKIESFWCYKCVYYSICTQNFYGNYREKSDSLAEMFGNDILNSIPAWISIWCMRSTTTSKLYDFSLGWKAKITTLYTWKRLMVRYFSSPNEQHLQCTAEVMRNFSPLLRDELYLQLLFSSDKVNRWAGTRWHLAHKKCSQGEIILEWKWPLGTLHFSFLISCIHSEMEHYVRSFKTCQAVDRT